MRVLSWKDPAPEFYQFRGSTELGNPSRRCCQLEPPARAAHQCGCSPSSQIRPLGCCSQVTKIKNWFLLTFWPQISFQKSCNRSWQSHCRKAGTKAIREKNQTKTPPQNFVCVCVEWWINYIIYLKLKCSAKHSYLHNPPQGCLLPPW